MPENIYKISNRDIYNEQVINDVIHFVPSRKIVLEIVNENIKNSNVTNNITISLSNSVEYEHLTESLKKLEIDFSNIPEENFTERLELSAQLNHQKEVVRGYIQDILTLAERFNQVAINTDRLRRAKDFFDLGKFGEARTVLELELDLMKDEQSKLLIQRKEFETGTLPKLKNNSDEFLILALSTQTDHSNPNRFAEAKQYFERSIESYANFVNYFEFAFFLKKYNQISDSVRYYNYCLEQFGQELPIGIKAQILVNLANSFGRLSIFGIASKNYERALEIFNTFAQNDPNLYFPLIGQTLNNYSLGLIKQYKLKEASEKLNEALKIIRKLTTLNSEPFEPLLSETLNNQGLLHLLEQNYSSAAKEFQVALQIRRELAFADPDKFLPELTKTLNNLARLYNYEHNFEDAQQAFEEALKIGRQLIDLGRNDYLPDFAEILVNFANLAQDRQNHPDAFEKYQEALHIYRELNRQSQDAFLPEIGAILNNFGILNAKEKKFSAALRDFDEALRIRRQLARDNPKTYSIDLAKTLTNLAVFHQEIGERESASEEFEEALAIYDLIEKLAPNTCTTDLAMCLNNLARLHTKEKKYQEASQEFEKALTIFQTLANKNPSAFLPNVAMLKSNLATFYFESVKDLAKSTAFATQTIAIFLYLNSNQPGLERSSKSAMAVLKKSGLSEKLIDLLILKEFSTLEKKTSSRWKVLTIGGMIALLIYGISLYFC